MNLIEILEWDTNHFGFKVARMNAATPEELQSGLDRCAALGVKLLIHRCSTDNIHFAHHLERQGFELMDINLRYCLSLADTQITHVPGPAIIRPCLNTDANDVAAIARTAFVGYTGHFHNDPRLDKDKCDALYIEWARNLCLDQNLADLVLVAEIEGKIVGYDSHKLINTKVADGVLSGVSPQTQGKGIRKALMVASNNWCKSHGLERMEEEVNINNYRIQSVLVSGGFRLYAAQYIFHKWF